MLERGVFRVSLIFQSVVVSCLFQEILLLMQYIIKRDILKLTEQ